MSKKVDERVVEMRFDNQQFESATKQTMSTLDKLKNALKFPSSSKSLEGVANAAKKVDFSGMSKGIETVNAKFSAMQVVGMTALSNITSAAMRAGTNIVKSFTLDPIISGFQEYETQLNSVQTILANTSSKGTTMDQVTAALDELNTYADQTIYNFTEMTRNIGTFTAAGVGLETSVSAIKGIANLAAVSGSTSQQASTAMYQLSQALAAGRVSLMDWNSVVNAGMGGEVFQNALKRTAKVMGKDVDAIIKKYGSFRESLTSGEWLTTDVLTETLKQFTMAAEEGSEQWNEFKKQLMDTGYTEAQAVEILKMANTATDAATKVKTFTQLMDTLKEAMGSGWSKTWQLIFGDFEEAKAFWTEMSDMFSGIVNNFSDARNNVLEAAMGGGESRWSEFTETLDKAGVSVESFQKKLGEVYKSGTGGSLDDLIKEYGSLEKAIGSGKISADMISKTFSELAVSTDGAAESTKSLAEWQKVVDDVWRGDYGNIDTGRIEKLAAAGWEYAEVQKLVNMTVDGHRLTLEDLNAAQLVSMGYTKEQAAVMEELAEQASAAGTPLNELIADLIEPKRSGRELFLEGIKNVLEAIMKPLGAVADAFGEVFAIDADGLYDLIKGFNEFSKAIIISKTDAANLGKTFKGLFSIVKLISTGVGKTLTFAFKAANALLAPFGTNVLEITGAVGEAIYQFSEWVTSGKSLGEFFDSLYDALGKFMIPITNFTNWLADIPVIGDALRSITDALRSISDLNAGDILGQIPKAVSIVVDGLKEAYNTLKGLTWQDVLNGLTDFGIKVREFFSKVAEDMKEVGPDIIEGLQNGLKDGIDGVVSFLKDLGTKIIEAICAVLGINSPSTVFFEIGTNIVQGLINGIKYLSGEVSGVIHDIVDDIKYALSGIDWGVVLPIAGVAGSFAILYQMADALQGFATAAKQFSSPFQSIANLGGSLKTTVDGFNNLMGFTDQTKSIKFKQIADGIKVLAEAIAILVGSLAVLTMLDQSKVQGAVMTIGALAVIIGVLAAALNKFASGGTVLESLQLNSTLIALGVAFGLFAVSAKIMGSMDYASVRSAEHMIAGFIGVITMLTFMVSVGKNIDKAASFLGKIGTAFLLLSVAAKILGTMDAGQISAAEEMMLAFGVIISLLMAVTQVGGKGIKRASSFIQQVGITFLLLAASAKIMGSMSTYEMNVAISCITVFGLVIAALMGVTKLIGGADMGTIGSTILQVAGAIALLAVVAAVIGGVDPAQLFNGIGAITVLGLIVIGLMGIVKIMGPGEAAKVGASLLSMTVSIGLLAGIAALLGLADPKQMAKGLVAIALLSAMMVAMTKATGKAGDVKGTFMGMAVAIGVLAASVAVLSFIDPGSLATATAAMVALMAMLVFVTRSADMVKGATGTMIAIGVVIGVIGAVLNVLAQQPWANVLASAAGLSLVLGTIVAALTVLNGVDSIATDAYIALAVLSGVMIAIGAVLWGMSELDVQNAIPNATALSMLLVTLAGVTAALSKITMVKIPTSALATMGIIAAAIAAVVAIASIIASFGGDGVIEAVQKGAELLNAVGNAIGQLIGGVLGGIAEGASNALPAIGENLAAFGESVTPFFETISGIDPAIGTTISNIGNGLLALTAGGLIEKLSGIFGESSIESLCSGLPLLGMALSAFAISTSMVDVEKTATAAQALKTVIDAFTNIPTSGGLVGMIFGNQDLGTFGAGMTSVGEGLKNFADSTADVTPDGIQPKAEALKTVIEALSDVPTSGGLLGMLFGDKNYESFSSGMKSIGDALKEFNDSTSGIESPDQLKVVAQALGVLIDGLANVPSSGGWLDNILGGKNYDSFGEGLKSLGGAVSEFYDSTSGIKDPETFTTVVNATKTLIDGLASIENTGGFLGMILGGQNFESFSSALGQIATGMETLGGISNSIEDVGTLNTIVSATNTLISGLSGITSTGGLFQMMLDGTSFSPLSSSLMSLGNGVANFANATANAEFTNMETAISGMQKMIEFISSTAELDTSGIETFKGAVDSLAETNISALVETFNNSAGEMADVGTSLVQAIADAFSSSSALTDAANTTIDNAKAAVDAKKSEFGTVGTEIVTEMANGIADNSLGVETQARFVVENAKTAASSAADGFSSVGDAIGQGIYNGLDGWAGTIAERAASIVTAAKNAAKEAGDINSPSRVFRDEVGAMMGVGLVLGLADYIRPASKSGAELAQSAIDGLSGTLSTMSAVLSSDLDVNPTIRPVLDLSDVRNGANSINSMFNASVPMNIMGDISSINRSMNDRIQNGTFKDVVDAVDKLRSGLADISGPSYTINGITYDDGSNIAAAVGGLTRAIRLEGRV